MGELRVALQSAFKTRRVREQRARFLVKYKKVGSNRWRRHKAFLDLRTAKYSAEMWVREPDVWVASVFDQGKGGILVHSEYHRLYRSQGPQFRGF